MLDDEAPQRPGRRVIAPGRVAAIRRKIELTLAPNPCPKPGAGEKQCCYTGCDRAQAPDSDLFLCGFHDILADVVLNPTKYIDRTFEVGELL